jgi:hypothetical protein
MVLQTPVLSAYTADRKRWWSLAGAVKILDEALQLPTMCSFLLRTSLQYHRRAT